MSLTLPLLLTAHLASYQHYGCKRKKTIQQGHDQAINVKMLFALVAATQTLLHI